MQEKGKLLEQEPLFPRKSDMYRHAIETIPLTPKAEASRSLPNRPETSRVIKLRENMKLRSNSTNRYWL